MNTRHHIVALGLVLSSSLGAAVPVVTMDVLTNGVSIGSGMVW